MRVLVSNTPILLCIIFRDKFFGEEKDRKKCKQVNCVKIFVSMK